MGSITRLALACAAALAAVLGLVYGVENRGAKKALAKVEKVNEKAIANADTAGARSRNPRVRGMRDPYAGHD